MSDIRFAVPLDIDFLMPLLRLRHAEAGSWCGTRRGQFDEPTVRLRIETMICGSGIGFIGVIKGEKEIEATIGLVVAKFWDQTAVHLENLFDFVHADYRRSTHAKCLRIFAKDVAERLKLPLILSQMENEATSQKVRLLDRTMDRTGAIFRHVPESCMRG
jgi:hypothetical protein